MSESADHLLHVTRLLKRYSTPVLVDFSFSLRRGEVHALIGSNGAGKSTFARILSGLTPRDGGDIHLAGDPYQPRSKRAAERAGVLMVPQEPTVLAPMTVAENMFLNRLPRRGGFVRFGDLYESARQSLARVGLAALDPATPAARLGMGQRQLIAIAGALSQPCRLLVLDEPTAALTDSEIDVLFDNIRGLTREGVGVIYVSHRMDEIGRIADRITVMRDGRSVATHEAALVAPGELIRQMVGHDLPERTRAAARAAGEVALRVRHLRAGAAVRDVSFDVRRGEILGIAGLTGAGRTETLRAIFGADVKTAGEVLVAGKRLVARKPADAVRSGIGLIPEDRQRDGLLLPQPVRVNTTLSTLACYARRGGWLDIAAEAAATDSSCARVRVQCASGEQPAAELSGGNQQKVVIARWLARDCAVLLCDEPTRGIDAAAKDTIYEMLRGLASEGKALVVVSSDLVELMALCDRILVMSLGRVAAEFMPPAWTQEGITRTAFSGYADRDAGGTAP